MIELELVVPGRNRVRRRFELGSYVIGRALSVDVRLKHDSVAKRHAQLTVTGEQLSLSEIDPEIGIRKEGKRVDIYGPLRVGDVFQLGECSVEVVSSLI